jgi:hypothetical protein
MTPAGDARSAAALFLAALVAVIAIHAFALATNGLDLHPDEAQYVVWARDPAAGYYSKPPMIAWSIAGLRTLCGEGEACVRLTGTVYQAGAAILVACAATLLWSPHAGAVAGLVYATLPMTVFSSLFVTTDAPLCFFAAAALVFAIRALAHDRWPDWLALGASFGLGLMSKYSMGVMIVAWIAYLLGSAATRARLLSRRHLSAALVAAALFAPNLLWNAALDFPTLRHTAEISQATRPALSVRELALFLASQAVVLGPLIAWSLIRGILDAPARVVREPLRLPATLFFVPLALFAALALFARANANWTAFALVPAAVFVAILADMGGRTRLLLAAVLVNVVIAVGFAFLPHALRASGVTLEGKANPLARVSGWRELGAAVAGRLRASPDLVLMTDERLAAAELLYYARPPVLVMWNPGGKVTDHFRLLHDVAARPGLDVLFVTRSTEPGELVPSFTQVEALAPIAVGMGRGEPTVFRVYRASGFRGYSPQ